MHTHTGLTHTCMQTWDNVLLSQHWHTKSHKLKLVASHLGRQALTETAVCSSRIFIPAVTAESHRNQSFLPMSVPQSCPAPWDAVVCSPPGSSVHGILQARTLQWVAMPPPAALPDPGVEPRSPALQADSLPSEPPSHSTLREIQNVILYDPCVSSL